MQSRCNHVDCTKSQWSHDEIRKRGKMGCSKPLWGRMDCCSANITLLSPLGKGILSWTTTI